MIEKDYISLNEKRRKALDAPYDPYIGIGSPLERIEILIGRTIVSKLGTVTSTWHVPIKMVDDNPSLLSHSIEEAGRKNNDSYETAQLLFDELRCEYDFEFWCATKAKIKDKEGNVIPFILNPPQRMFLVRLEDQRLAGTPVRQIVLKHRQWGCTTMSYTYIAWHQIVLYTGRDAWFVGHNLDGAGDVVKRYDVIRQSCGIEMKGYANSGATKEIVGRDALVSVGTVEKPNAPSGRAAQYIHLFEIGKWPSNPKVSAERVTQNVDSMLAEKPGTIEIIESTAQAATGPYFKKLCDKAQAGESAFDFLFVSWLDDPQYQRDIKLDTEEFVSSWQDSFPGEKYCSMLWDMGATLEQINWYNYQTTKPGFIDRWRLMEEFPTDVSEAFQMGGRRVFAMPYVQAARSTCKEPAARGYLEADANTGEGAFLNIKFVEDAHGPLRIWRMPDDNYSNLLQENAVSNRCVAASDIGPGKWEGADYNCCAILDRAPMLFGGMPEIVAEWHGHLDKDLFAWESARLSFWYHQAQLVIEVNSLIEDNETRYDPSLTVLDEIIPYYPYLYVREIYDNVEQKMTQKVGFHMNAQTKDNVISQLNKRLREFYESREGSETVEGYIERCHEATAEMDNYKVHEDGSMGSTSRAQRSDRYLKDDRVIVRALLAWLHGHTSVPSYIETQRVRQKQTAGMANF